MNTSNVRPFPVKFYGVWRITSDMKKLILGEEII